MKSTIEKVRSIRYVKTMLSAQKKSPAAFKKDIFKDYMNAFILNRYDDKENRVSFLGRPLYFSKFGFFMYLLDEIFFNQEYAFVSDNEKPFIIDCGSNIGMSIIYFKYFYPNASVIGFEPETTAFSCLEKNIKERQLSDVVAYKKALAKEEGEMTFHLDSDGDASLTSSGYSDEDRESVTVETDMLSKHIDRDVDFLKMDIEGGEMEVMEELSNSGAIKFIKQASIEYHHHYYSNGDTLSRFLKLLEDNGMGYQIEGKLKRPYEREKPQNMIIYAYRK